MKNICSNEEEGEERGGDAEDFEGQEKEMVLEAEGNMEENINKEENKFRSIEENTEEFTESGVNRGGRQVQKVLDPRRPTANMVQEHKLGFHVDYRNWCLICVQARGRDLQHRSDPDKERSYGEYSLDYCFPGDELGFKLTTLVGRERNTGNYLGTSVPYKGLGVFVADKVLDWVEECGDKHNAIILKTDQEPAIVSMVDDVQFRRSQGRVVHEKSKEEDSKSNGVAEAAVREMEGQMRVLFLQLEECLGFSIEARAPLVTHLPEFAAYVINRLRVGNDGFTNYERAKGKQARVLGIEFGEKLLYRRDIKKVGQFLGEKLRSRWDYGIFVGVIRKSGEFLVSREDGDITRAKSVRRIPLEDRWGEDNINWVKRPPWNQYKGDENADGEVPEEYLVTVDQQLSNSTSNKVIYVQSRVPKDFSITMQDGKKYGFTKGCPGCSSYFRGTKQSHNSACRQRFRSLFMEDAKRRLRVTDAEKRRKEFEEKINKENKEKENSLEEKEENIGGSAGSGEQGSVEQQQR